jgi:hypothetical protein
MHNAKFGGKIGLSREIIVNGLPFTIRLSLKTGDFPGFKSAHSVPA